MMPYRPAEKTKESDDSLAPIANPHEAVGMKQVYSKESSASPDLRFFESMAQRTKGFRFSRGRHYKFHSLLMNIHSPPRLPPHLRRVKRAEV
jgi:hypothetical protein